LVESDGELYMVTLFNTNTRRDAWDLRRQPPQDGFYESAVVQGEWSWWSCVPSVAVLSTSARRALAAVVAMGWRRTAPTWKKAVMIFDVKEGTIEMQNLDNEVPESDI
jgi:hypothetical protein